MAANQIWATTPPQTGFTAAKLPKATTFQQTINHPHFNMRIGEHNPAKEHLFARVFHLPLGQASYTLFLYLMRETRDAAFDEFLSGTNDSLSLTLSRLRQLKLVRVAPRQRARLFERLQLAKL